MTRTGPRRPLARRTIRFSLDLSQKDYKLLCDAWLLRRGIGLRTSMRALVLEAIRAHDFAAEPQAS